jgi:hypothetical protein
MNIYKVTIYRFRAEQVEYSCYFSSFKQAKNRLFWQLTAIGEESKLHCFPRKPESVEFITDNYTCRIAIIEVNQTFGCVLGSWFETYNPAPTFKRL